MPYKEKNKTWYRSFSVAHVFCVFFFNYLLLFFVASFLQITLLLFHGICRITLMIGNVISFIVLDKSRSQDSNCRLLNAQNQWSEMIKLRLIK